MKTQDIAMQDHGPDRAPDWGLYGPDPAAVARLAVALGRAGIETVAVAGPVGDAPAGQSLLVLHDPVRHVAAALTRGVTPARAVGGWSGGVAPYTALLRAPACLVVDAEIDEADLHRVLGEAVDAGHRAVLQDGEDTQDGRDDDVGTAPSGSLDPAFLALASLLIERDPVARALSAEVARRVRPGVWPTVDQWLETALPEIVDHKREVEALRRARVIIGQDASRRAAAETRARARLTRDLDRRTAEADDLGARLSQMQDRCAGVQDDLAGAVEQGTARLDRARADAATRIAELCAERDEAAAAGRTEALRLIAVHARDRADFVSRGLAAEAVLARQGNDRERAVEVARQALEARTEDQAREIDGLRAEVDRVLYSRSVRLTAPLRRMWRWLRPRADP